MDLYSEKGPASAQKVTITLVELVLIVVSAWVMFGGGEALVARLFGFAPATEPPARRFIIVAFNVIVLIRMAFMMFYLMKRAIPWSEAFTVPLAFAIYYVGYGLLVLPSRAPLGALDWFGIALFFFGSYLNTGGELGRHFFKSDPKNKGKLYTGGLFAYSMHINFFGDILWVTGYALITQNPWSALIPIAISLFFAFGNVPLLDKHLAKHYGEQFTKYAAHTKKLIPFVW
jgi:protein-S-isoprenylcysteine O-methyltransferase Ste14